MYKAILFFGILVFPVVSFAAVLGRADGIKGIIQGVGGIISLLIPIIAGLCLVFFFWGLAKFILHADNDEARTEGKKMMMWGIVALFVLVSIWGIVLFLRNEFGIPDVTGLRV